MPHVRSLPQSDFLALCRNPLWLMTFALDLTLKCHCIFPTGTLPLLKPSLAPRTVHVMENSTRFEKLANTRFGVPIPGLGKVPEKKGKEPIIGMPTSHPRHFEKILKFPSLGYAPITLHGPARKVWTNSQDLYATSATNNDSFQDRTWFSDAWQGCKAFSIKSFFFWTFLQF